MSEMMKLRKEIERLEGLLTKKDKLIDELDEESQIQADKIKQLEHELDTVQEDPARLREIDELQRVSLL